MYHTSASRPHCLEHTIWAFEQGPCLELNVTAMSCNIARRVGLLVGWLAGWLVVNCEYEETWGAARLLFLVTYVSNSEARVWRCDRL